MKGFSETGHECLSISDVNSTMSRAPGQRFKVIVLRKLHSGVYVNISLLYNLIKIKDFNETCCECLSV